MRKVIGVRMLQQRVLLEPLEEPKVQTGNLVVPDTVAKNLGRAKIVSVDEGKLRVGDVVLYDTRQGMTCSLEGEEYVIVHESNVFAVLGQQKGSKKSG